MDEISEAHGNVLTAPAQGAPCATCGGRDAVIGSHASGTLVKVASTTELIAVGVLASGIGNAALLFIWLSFQHPDAANIVVPLILTPLLTFLAARWKERKDRGKA